MARNLELPAWNTLQCYIIQLLYCFAAENVDRMNKIISATLPIGEYRQDLRELVKNSTLISPLWTAEGGR